MKGLVIFGMLLVLIAAGFVLMPDTTADPVSGSAVEFGGHDGWDWPNATTDCVPEIDPDCGWNNWP